MQALDDSKASIQSLVDGDDLAELPPDQYKLQMELYKAKKAYLEKLKDLPETLIEWLTSPDTARENFDPYEN